MGIMDSGLKLYASDGGFNLVYVGYIECWYKDSDPVTFSIRMADGSSLAISRKDISFKYRWYYNKNDPAFKDPHNMDFEYVLCQ